MDAESSPTTAGFTVVLQRSGRTLAVPPGTTVLDALLQAGEFPPYSCQQGICGTCEVKVLEGVPDHRDFVLSAEEQAVGDRMMICCSGARSAQLVLDL